MSRIAKQPIEVPKGVEIKIDGQTVSAKGPKGNEACTVHDNVGIEFDNGVLGVKAKSEEKSAVAMAGTMRSLLNNLVTGVSEGFEKKLELRGVGYRAQAKGNGITMQLGFSHDVNYPAPDGIKINVLKPTQIVVEGIDKQKVGQVAAEIRSFRKPEPYKGKGVRYVGEYVRQKEGKKK